MARFMAGIVMAVMGQRLGGDVMLGVVDAAHFKTSELRKR